MPASASERRRRGYRLAAREVPSTWLAAGGVVALGLLLIAGGGPLRPALATFGIGVVAALALAWFHGAAARYRARRRAEAADAAVLRECVARLRAAADGGAGAQVSVRTSELLAALAALVGADQPRASASLAALSRGAAAAVRPEADDRDVRLIVAVGQDTTVDGAGLDPALRGLLRSAAAASPPGSTVTVSLRSGRVEIRDDAPAEAGDPFAADLARAVAHRAGGELHVFDRADGPGTLAVLELPAAAPGESATR
jgi:signal transduction histidine kinase